MQGTVAPYFGVPDSVGSTSPCPSNLSTLFENDIAQLLPSYASSPGTSYASSNSEAAIVTPANIPSPADLSPCGPDMSSFHETDSPPRISLSDLLTDAATPTTLLPTTGTSYSSILTAAPTPVSVVPILQSTIGSNSLLSASPVSIHDSSGSIAQSSISVSPDFTAEPNQTCQVSVIESSVSTTAPVMASVSAQLSSALGDVSVSSSSQHTTQLQGFRLVADNIDKTVKPRYMRLNSQSSSLHFCHVYAVKDRINFGDLSSNATLIDRTTINITQFLPTSEDETALRSNFEVLISRILTKSILKADVTDHIPHKYSKEMSQKSEVVCKILHI